MSGARLYILLAMLCSFSAHAVESEYARQVRQDIREEAYNFWTRNPSIESILHYPKGPSHRRFPCADFVTWLLEATVNFPKRPDDQLIVVQARSNYRYMIQKMGWQASQIHSLNKLPTTFDNVDNPRPQGCLAYFYKRANNTRLINIRHVGLVYTANAEGIKIIDASGHLGQIVYRSVNDSFLVTEGDYAKVQFVCPPNQAN